MTLWLVSWTIISACVALWVVFITIFVIVDGVTPWVKDMMHITAHDESEEIVEYINDKINEIEKLTIKYELEPSEVFGRIRVMLNNTPRK